MIQTGHVSSFEAHILVENVQFGTNPTENARRKRRNGRSALAVTKDLAQCPWLRHSQKRPDPRVLFFLVRIAAAVVWTREYNLFDVYVPSLASGGVWLTRTAQASQKRLSTRFVLKTLFPSTESSNTDQDESSRVLRFYVVCESRIEIHPTSGQ